MAIQKNQVILNPTSGGGKTSNQIKKILGNLEKHFGNNLPFHITTKKADAENISRNSIKNGADLIIGVGGDGTLNEILNGFFENGRMINKNCRLGIISSGSGEGFSRSLGLPKNLSEQVEIIKNGSTNLIDIGKVIFSRPDKERVERYFLNEFQIGIGGEVVKNVNSSLKKLGGSISFALGTIKSAISHPNQFISIKMDSEKEVVSQFVGLVVANGHLTGGGMNLVPGAKIDDGKFDILFIHKQTPLMRLWNFPKIYLGRHIRSDKFEIKKAYHLEINSNDKVYIEADGELLENLPCSVDILPSQLNVCS